MVTLAAAAPLRARDFRLFWLGQWISQCGDNVFLVAQAWLVYSLTGSAAAMATLALCSQIPGIAMLLLGGAMVDRLPRRTVAICSDALRGALLLAAAVLLAAGRLTVWHLYGLAAAFGLVSAFARPAFRALVQALAPPEQRAAANALVSGGGMVAGVAGPALAGLVMALGGAGLAFALDGLSFLAAVTGMALARPPEPAQGRRGERLRLTALLHDLAPAVRVLAGRRFLLGTVLAMALIHVTGQAPVVVLRPWIAAHVAGGGSAVLSGSYTAFAAGMGLAVLALGGLRARRRGLWIYGGLAAAGLCQVGLAAAAFPWQVWLCEFALGAGVMTYGVLWETLLQESVPPEAMGRVAALDEFGASVLYPGGLALVGALVAGPGPRAAMLGGGLLTALVAVVGLLTPPVRQQA